MSLKARSETRLEKDMMSEAASNVGAREDRNAVGGRKEKASVIACLATGRIQLHKTII